MKIKSLHLRNIRSYENVDVEFSEGITLFEGDIGSGKSTILMAIEFALFGLGSEKGAALLRIGTDEGSVSLKFQVDETTYTAYRSLKKRKNGVQQDKCYINVDGTEFKFSPTEMKERILQILKFNEPANSRAKSVIYRYAVFTPQEEMKAIIQLSPDQRLQTLRKALRIEDYKIAINNALNLARDIDKKSVELISKASNLGPNRRELQIKVDAVGKNRSIIKELSVKCQEKDIELDKLIMEIKKHQKEKEKLLEAKGKIPLIKKQIKDNNEEILRIDKNSSESQEIIKKTLYPKLEELNALKSPTDKKDDELSGLINKLRNAEKYLTTHKATIEAKINDYRAIENNSVCPTCDRPLDPAETKRKMEPLLEEVKHLKSKLEDCEKEIKETETLQRNLKEYQDHQKEIIILKSQVQDKLELIKRNKDSIDGMKKQIITAEELLPHFKKEIEKGKNIEEYIDELENKRGIISERLSHIKSELSSKKTAVEMYDAEIQRLNEQIRKEKSFKKKGEKLREYHIWIKDFFIPSLENIENQVMMSINLEFNQDFQRWFSLLVDDQDKTAMVNEDFTPIVEQDGYEQEIDYLSGGEKTSVALAYRLSLNSIVQSISTGIRSDVLILDEPTDGFSKEQLFKLREILEELECPQIILVSHEKELESFADHLFRIEKKEGRSEISS